MDCSPPGSSDHRISQPRILEWVAISIYTGSPHPWVQTPTSCIGRWILYQWATWEAPKGIMLYEITQTEEDKYSYDLTYMSNLKIKRNKQNENIFRYREQMDNCQKGGGGEAGEWNKWRGLRGTNLLILNILISYPLLYKKGGSFKRFPNLSSYILAEPRSKPRLSKPKIKLL